MGNSISEVIDLVVNQDLEKRLKYVYKNIYHFLQNIVLCDEKDKIIGWLSYSFREEDQKEILLFETISIDEHFRGLGYASQLIEQCVLIAKELGKPILITSFTSDGSSKIKPKIETICLQYNVELIYNL